MPPHRKLVFRPPGASWARSHAQNPFAEDLGDGRARVHFACRDEHNRSRGAAIDVNWDELAEARVPAMHPRLTLDIGALGAFDDAGAMPHSVLDVDGATYLYYTGWSLTVAVPFAFHIGLAVSRDGGARFERVSQAPVLGRNADDPYIAGAPWVLREGGLFRMWYASCTGWARIGDEVRHNYTIKHAESADGATWKTSPHLCIDYGPGEYALARPVVWREGGDYRMLFSFRGDGGTYRVGGAMSLDGIEWTRDREPILQPAAEGWDSEMVCYAWPFTHDGRRYLLYNGNGYGRDGFGVARAD
jgi:hypothetical protein